MDPIPFLANIALVAHADGKLSPSELGQLEAIRSELKFKKGDYNAAIRLVEQGGYKMTPVGRFADQVKNLELILRVAYSDDDLDEAEAALVGEFCKGVGIYQDQVEKICAEVLASLKQTEKVCPSCRSSAEATARFCPKCGANLSVETEAIQVKLSIPSSGLAIEFADSTAATFPQALEITRASEGFQTCQRNKKTWYLATYPSGNVEEALPLVHALGGIRNRRLYLDGDEKQWDEVFGFSWCAAKRDAAYRPVDYCFGKDDNRINPWGCKLASMDWTDWADWFSYGQWETTGLLKSKPQWRFDKERICHELNNNIHGCRHCPHLRPKLCEAVLLHLPDTVTPKSDRNWDYKRDYDEVPGSIKVVEKETQDGMTMTDEFWSDGVRPKGLRGFAALVSKALSDAGITDVSAETLIK